MKLEIFELLIMCFLAIVSFDIRLPISVLRSKSNQSNNVIFYHFGIDFCNYIWVRINTNKSGNFK